MDVDVYFILPYVLPLILYIVCKIREKSRMNKLNDQEKQTLKNSKTKVKKTRILMQIIPAILGLIVIAFGIILIVEQFGVSCGTIDYFQEIIYITIALYSILVVEYIAFLVYINKNKKLEAEEKRLLIHYYKGNLIFLIVSAFWVLFFENNLRAMTDYIAKPIIYLYPEEKTNVNVKVNKKEILTCTYPKYNDEWNVTAYPDGTLEDKSGRKYYALYWEGQYNVEVDKKVGFCVKGEDTINFFEKKLKALGLNDKEAEEFIVYWLPQLERNKYNYIYFKQTQEMNEILKLDITPKPTSVIRILMVFKPLDKEINLEEQKITTPTREGFTVVEWGGTKI